MAARFLLLSVCFISGDKTPAPQSTSAIVRVEPDRASLQDTITITVMNPPTGKQPGEWIPYLDGIPIKGVHPENQDFLREGKIRFRLERNDASKDSWLKVLRGTPLERQVDLALGTEKEVDLSIAPLSGKFTLVVLSPRRLIGYLTAFASLLIVMVLLARRSTLLRNRDVIPPEGKQGPFSLGLTQMAFWFFLVIAGYLFIAIVTRDYTGSISTSILILMGISSGTALGAVAIDSDKGRRRRELEIERNDLASQIRSLELRVVNAADNERQQLQEERNKKLHRDSEIGAALQSLPAGTAASKGFFYDLVSDDTGVSLHRFQIVCWTAILGVVFVVEVIKNLAMPEFNPTLLGLMGISSGTYLGFKFPERKA